MSAVEAPTTQSFWENFKFWKTKTPEELITAENSLNKTNIDTENKRHMEAIDTENKRHMEAIAKIKKPVVALQTPPQPPQQMSNGSGAIQTNGSGVAPTATPSSVGGRKSKRPRRIKGKNTKRKR
jgi:hypothetical protein